MPGLAAIPVRGTRMPSLQGLAWAMAGAHRDEDAASTLVAVIDFRAARRVIRMYPTSAVRCIAAFWTMIYQR